MELATALHHRAQRPRPVVEEPKEGVEGEHEVYYALRRQKPPPPGTRPAPLEEVAVLHGFGPGAPCQPGHGVPSLAPPSLADAAAEGCDASTLSFLTRAALEEKRKEEEAMVEQQEAKDAEELALLQEAEGEGGSRPWTKVPVGPTITTLAPGPQGGHFPPRPLWGRVRRRGRGRRKGKRGAPDLLFLRCCSSSSACPPCT